LNSNVGNAHFDLELVQGRQQCNRSTVHGDELN